MTKRFQYTYSRLAKDENGEYHQVEVTLKKTVTDKMEERDHWKIVYAMNWFQDKIRKDYWSRYTVSRGYIEEL